MVTRRELLGGRISGPAVRSVPRPVIRPRQEWAGDLGPTGPLTAEDLRFLLVHHTAGTNTYGPDEVPAVIRSIYELHTGASKGWPDVAYNFFVDRFGTVWEGRLGSLDGPVRGDATGGSQGFGALCCFLGDHSNEVPTPPAQGAMIGLLAHLAVRYSIPVSDGATATFTSRGSNRHPAGTTVVTPTISAHRDMSATECPGDAAYALVTGLFRTEVAAMIRGAPPATTTTASPTTSAPPTTDPPPTTRSDATTTTTTVADRSTPSGDERAAPVPPTSPAPPSDGVNPWGARAGVVTLFAAAAGGLIALRRRMRHLEPE